MGLLDQFTNLSPEQTQGLLSFAQQMLQAGGPSRMPTSFGQALGAGIGGYQSGVANARKQKQEQEQAAQIAQLRAQGLQTGQMDIEQRQRSAEQEQALQGAYGEAGNDPMKLVEAVSRIDPMKGFQLRQELAKSTEFDTKPQVGVDADGKPFTYILRKDGTQKRLDGTLPRDELKLANLGGKDMAYNPFALQPGQTFQRTMTPEGAANNALGWANYNKPQYSADAGGFVSLPSKANPSGAFTPLSGVHTRSAKMTEDQGKATGWLVQAENAYKNMMAVGRDEKGNPTDAAKPGINDGLEGIPSFGIGGAIANTFRGADRQKFIQATSSLSEALLRAATGAGVNKEEAAQKVAELTPRFGEDAEVTKQKYEAIPLYIESLKVRAGPGAARAAELLKPGKSGWGIQRVED